LAIHIFYFTIFFRIYVDGKWYGEIRANKASNRHGYQYYLNDLPPEQTYDINVKAIAGYKRTDPDSQHIFSMSDSPMSNTLPVSAPAAPKSPKLMLEGLHPEGIDVSWQVPQQFGDAAISVSLFYRISFVFIENKKF
jgi:hypothetical protein